jgi:hypothetical protein
MDCNHLSQRRAKAARRVTRLALHGQPSGSVSLVRVSVDSSCQSARDGLRTGITFDAAMQVARSDSGEGTRRDRVPGHRAGGPSHRAGGPSHRAGGPSHRDRVPCHRAMAGRWIEKCFGKGLAKLGFHSKKWPGIVDRATPRMG